MQRPKGLFRILNVMGLVSLEKDLTADKGSHNIDEP